MTEKVPCSGILKLPDEDFDVGC